MTLKQRRKKKKFTQEEIAKELGISERQFRRYEQYETDPPLHIGIKWAELLGIGIGKFVALYNKESE
jgi:transcriptional regulator with XRE-family HTH domain